MFDGTIQTGVIMLKDKYKLNEKSISKLLGLDPNTLDEDYMSNYTDQTNHAEYVLPFLVGSLDATSDDDKLAGVIEGLIYYFDLSIETLAIYAGITPTEMKAFTDDPNSLSIEKKYHMGMRMMLLHFVLKESYRVAIDN
ncbi:HTH domain-containing protein [Listeria rocourtiae]|uniref:HTH domain-containing protein n=1 Tax=Listeria rocourtiae TaxID=647910 RepID=UPI003D2F5F39